MTAPIPDLPPVNPGDRPSRLDLARHATGEATIAGPVDEVWLRALHAERSRVEPFDWEILRARAERLDDPPPAPRRPSPFARFLPLLALAAVGFAVAVLPRAPAPAPEEGLKGPPASGGGMSAPPGRRGPEELLPSDLSVASGPAYGDVGILSYVVQRGDHRMRGTRNLVLEAGDQIGFRCYSARYRHMVLVTVGADGAIAPLDPDVGIAPIPIEPGQRVPIDAHFVSPRRSPRPSSPSSESGRRTASVPP